jgi:hypothetical protein
MLLEEKLTRVRFPSWCNVFDDNIIYCQGALAFIYRAMLLEGKLT